MASSGAIENHHWKLWSCDQATGRESLVEWGDKDEILKRMEERANRGSDVWVVDQDGRKHLPSKSDNAFKAYVHKRLDSMGIPSDPDVERTERTGCRIGSRLNHVASILEEVEAIRDDMWVSVDDANWSEETKRVVGNFAERLVAALRT